MFRLTPFYGAWGCHCEGSQGEPGEKKAFHDGWRGSFRSSESDGTGVYTRQDETTGPGQSRVLIMASSMPSEPLS